MAESHKLSISPRGDREIVMSRDFDAPRQLVWDAWTKPELVKRWLCGPEGWSLTRCDIDLRVGGAYRFELTRTGIHEAADSPFEWKDEVMGWGGVYLDLAEPERWVNTELFDEAWYEGESLLTYVLTEHDGVTHLESTMRLVSTEARDTALTSGMDEGMDVDYARLDELLAQIQAETAAMA